VINIHSSSAAQPSSFVRPNPADLNNKPAQLPTANDQNNSGQTSPVSTPEQIQAAVAKTGLTRDDNFSQETDRRTRQALQIYNQTRNQPMQTQLENLIVRVDYFA